MDSSRMRPTFSIALLNAWQAGVPRRTIRASANYPGASRNARSARMLGAAGGAARPRTRGERTDLRVLPRVAGRQRQQATRPQIQRAPSRGEFAAPRQPDPPRVTDSSALAAQRTARHLPPPPPPAAPAATPSPPTRPPRRAALSDYKSTAPHPSSWLILGGACTVAVHPRRGSSITARANAPPPSVAPSRGAAARRVRRSLPPGTRPRAEGGAGLCDRRSKSADLFLGDTTDEMTSAG